MNDITKTTADLSKYLDTIFNEEILLNKQKMILQQLKAQGPIKEYVDASQEEKEYNEKIAAKSSEFQNEEFWTNLVMIAMFIPLLIVVGVNTGFKGVIIAIVLFGIIYNGVCNFQNKTRRENEKELDEEYKEALKKVAFQNNLLEEKYNLQLSIWNDTIRHVEKRIDEIKEVLTLLYSDNIIYVKYRNIVAISAFKEYVESGRAKNLMEAYDRFELEYRLDTMQNTLNRIDDKLDLILNKIDNITFELSEALRKNNEESEKFRCDMIQYIDTIKENQEEQQKNLTLIQNDQHCIAENTKVLGYIKNTQKRNFDMTPFIKMYNQKMYN